MIFVAVASIIGILKSVSLIAVALIALGVVVFAHEWGHFMAGRRVGIRAEAFSIGFGPILWRRKVGETEYRLSAILFGGYVKFAGMEGTKDKTPQEIERGFYAVSPARRILAAFSGPFMNVVLAVALFFVLWGTGRKVHESEATTVVGGLIEGSAADKAGLQPGDRILSVGGRAVKRWNDIRIGVALSGETLELEYERDGKVNRVNVTPDRGPNRRRTLGVYAAYQTVVKRVVEGSAAERMGLQPGDMLRRLDGEPVLSGAAWEQQLAKRGGRPITITVERDGAALELAGTMPQGTEKKPPVVGFEIEAAPVFLRIYENPWEATVYCFDLVWRTLKGLATQRVSVKDLGGPVLIVGGLAGSLQVSFTFFLWFAAFISLNLVVINLLPIPVVDGGHIVFSLIEAVRRKPVREKTMAIITNVFAALIIAFFLYITFNDIQRLLPSSRKQEEAPPAEEAAPESPGTDTPEPELAPPE